VGLRGISLGRQPDIDAPYYTEVKPWLCEKVDSECM
jgi:hypothetical protein